MSDRNRGLDPETFVRGAHAIAERMDLDGWKSLFADDGIFIDESVRITYRGPHEWDYPVRNYGTAFADMHRELFARLHAHGAARDSVRRRTADGKEDGCSVRGAVGQEGEAANLH